MLRPGSASTGASRVGGRVSSPRCSVAMGTSWVVCYFAVQQERYQVTRTAVPRQLGVPSCAARDSAVRSASPPAPNADMDSGKKITPDSGPRSLGGSVVSGWDPYEVWRTKILLPRLADQEAQRRAQLAAAQRLYVVAPRSKPAQPAPAAERAPAASAPTRSGDEALKRELIDVLGSLLAIGLASAFYGDDDRRRPALLPTSRGVCRDYAGRRAGRA